MHSGFCPFGQPCLLTGSVQFINPVRILIKPRFRPAGGLACVTKATLSTPGAAAYYRVMQIVVGTVVAGKVVLEGASLPEGTVVTVLAKDTDATVRLSPSLQAELEEALDEADREEGISGSELLERLEKYD